MKTCMECLETVPEDDAPHCHNCGGGSFDSTVAPKADGIGAARTPSPCQKCNDLKYRPCSVECFVAAGYKAEDYDRCIARCESDHAKAEKSAAKEAARAAKMAAKARGTDRAGKPDADVDGAPVDDDEFVIPDILGLPHPLDALADRAEATDGSVQGPGTAISDETTSDGEHGSKPDEKS